MNANEKIFYQDDAVRITDSQLKIGDSNYILANISSFRVVIKEAESIKKQTETQDTKSGCAGCLIAIGVLGVIGLIAALLGIGEAPGFGSLGDYFGAFVLCIGFIIGGAIWLAYVREKKPVKLPDKYILSITSSAGEKGVLEIERRETMEKVIDALNLALKERSGTK